MNILKLFKRPTPEEMEHRKIVHEAHKNICFLKRTISKVLEGFQFYEYTNRGKRPVSFDRVFITPEGGTLLRFDLRPGKWPKGMAAGDLMSERIMKHIALVLDRNITITEKFEPGIWIHVHGPNEGKCNYDRLEAVEFPFEAHQQQEEI